MLHRSAIFLGFWLLVGGCTPAAQTEEPGTGGAGTGGAAAGAGGAASGGNGASPSGGSGGGGAASGGNSGGGGGTGGAPSGTGGGPPAGTGGTSSGTGGGAGGRPGTGGTSGTGGAGPDAGGGDATSTPDLAPLMECPGASIDRLQKWLGHAHLVGSGGDASILTMEGGRYVAKARFDGADWSEIVVLLGNSADASIDLTKSSGFTIRYSATADLYIEFRGTVHLHGGDQFGVKLPATGGMPVSRFVSFQASDWGEIPGLDKPTHAYASVLKTANMFDIVGMTANTVAFYGLRFDQYEPACK